MKTYLLVLPFMALLTIGCNTVTIRQPLGDRDPNAYKLLQGIWMTDEGEIIEARVSDLGQLFVGNLEWDEAKDKFKTETLNVRATRAGKLQLLQIKDDPKTTDERFAFARYEIVNEKTVRVYPPNAAVFEVAVKTGRLKGTVQKKQFASEVRLDDTSEAVLEFIAKTGVDACFGGKPLSFTLLHRRD
jgi:hypothetical protein